MSAAAVARAPRRARRDTKGTTVELHEDGVRRVAQCSCGASMVYRGAEKLWAAGWGSHFRNGVRYWECDACWSPPKAGPEAPIYRADPAMLEVAARPKGAARERLGRQMIRLLELEPPRGVAFLDAIVEHVRELHGESATRWRALRELVASGAFTGRKRARPKKPGKAQPQRRRVVGEVASEVVAVRLTPTELQCGEELAKGMKLGLWFRRMLQLASDGVLRPVEAPAQGSARPTINDLVDELVAAEDVRELQRVCDAALDALNVVRRRRKERNEQPKAAAAPVPDSGPRLRAPGPGHRKDEAEPEAASVNDSAGWVRLVHWEGKGPAHTLRESSGWRNAVCGLAIDLKAFSYAPHEARDCRNCALMRTSHTARGARWPGADIPAEELSKVVEATSAAAATEAEIAKSTGIQPERVALMARVLFSRGELTGLRDAGGVQRWLAVARREPLDDLPAVPPGFKPDAPPYDGTPPTAREVLRAIAEKPITFNALCAMWPTVRGCWIGHWKEVLCARQLIKTQRGDKRWFATPAGIEAAAGKT